MLKTATAAACLIATSAVADPMAGLQNHYIQQAYIQEPCAKVIEMIDTPDQTGDDFMNGIFAIVSGATTDKPVEEILQDAKPLMDFVTVQGNIAMAFGFLMGFEATHPDIAGTHETVLMRLRADCAADPTKTAMEYLLAYAGD